MAYDRFLIGGPYKGAGLETNLRPYAIADEAFETLRNAYTFRGRVRKRLGARVMNTGADQEVQQLFTRLRVNIGTTNGAGTLAGNVRAIVAHATIPTAVGQLFSVGNIVFTVADPNPGPQQMLRSDGLAAVATYNLTTSDFDIQGAPALTDVYFYVAQPVMGLITYERPPINSEPVYGFDTQFAYEFVGGGWERLGTAAWTGNNSQFFWGVTYRGASGDIDLLFVSNFNTPDLIWYWQGAPVNAWTQFSPVIQVAAAGPPVRVAIDLLTARIIVPFKNRLVFLNVVEDVDGTATSFENRCRYSQDGSPVDVDAFRQDIPGRGNFIDASTQEAIVSAQFVKDRLIVFFERSTWELVFTGNQVEPFIWQKINTELGVESTFSVIPFDKAALGIGQTGIHACNGANVERIDSKIPDLVFNIHNDNAGVFRVHGIRDYYNEFAYWTFPSDNNNDIFPTQILLYNYQTNSWALNDDSITTFGYFQKNDDLIWSQASSQWQAAIDTWAGAPLQSNFRDIVAGNQEGFVFIFADLARNAAVLQITNMTVAANIVTITAINHNLKAESFVRIDNATGITALNDTIREVQTVPSADTFTIQLDTGETAPGIYSGRGTLERVSQIDILTKQYNFYQKQGKNIFLAKVDFMVDKTADGSITVDYFPSSSPISLVQGGLVSGAQLGNNVLETSPYTLNPLETWQARVWHPVYFMGEGEVVQLRIYFTPEQMRIPQVVESDFQLHAMIAYTIGVSRLQ